MRKSVCIVVVSVAALIGFGGSISPARAATPPSSISVNAAAPACLRLYLINQGTCVHLR